MTIKPYPQRRSPRLQGYDYTQSGAYFVTICTHQRQHLFGHIAGDAMHLSPSGSIAQERWHAIPDHYPAVDLDAFVVMPNHVHGILVLTGDPRYLRPTLGRVVNAYKGAVTAQIRQAQASGVVVWQARYHDHIIRDERGLQKIRDYVLHNPALWAQDTFYGE